MLEGFVFCCVRECVKERERERERERKRDEALTVKKVNEIHF